ncbi:hypothetical protein [Enemella sp. A6]|uniref:hypothetical protein n=1 Tax=Enemella sp. A6 TaxID=3440152 RepID=UPI003EB87C6D
MSSLVRPVGPDSPRTYWARRVVVLLAVLVAVALLMWLLWPKGSEPVATAPSTPQTPAASEPTPDPSETAGQETSPPAGSSPTPAPSPTQAPSSSAPPTTTQPSPSATPTATPTPTPTAVAACKPDDLRVTLTGPPKVTAGKTVDFELSVINGGSGPCALKIGPDNFELKVYSGTDRIWTTKNCADWVPKLAAELPPEKATTWTMAWPAKRSADKCKIRDEVLRPGTYVATAQLEGAKAVQHVMSLR